MLIKSRENVYANRVKLNENRNGKSIKNVFQTMQEARAYTVYSTRKRSREIVKIKRDFTLCENTL